MPAGLKRYQRTGDLHFLTFSCYRRRPYLATPHAKQIFSERLEHLRETHRFTIHGYVLMPEHVHLLLSEPESLSLASTLRVLKGETSRRLRIGECPFWQARYYDFNVFSRTKRLEKLVYIHQNPVKRGLVSDPEAYPWSSARHYASGESGPVTMGSA